MFLKKIIEKLKNISEFEQIGEYYIIGEEKSDAGLCSIFFLCG